MSEGRDIAIVTGGGGHTALPLLIEAATEGIGKAGGAAYELDATGRDPAECAEWLLGASGILLAIPVKLFSLPSDVKAVFDAWLDLVPSGRVVPATSGMSCGYIAVYHPQDPDQVELCHQQLKKTFSFFGMNFRGRVAGYAPPGTVEVAQGYLMPQAERLGASLVEPEGAMVGYPPGYLTGADLFNKGEYYECHEAWEDIWLEDEGPLKLFYQGLIQVAAGFHHQERENWGGMAALLDQAFEKLQDYRPRTQGLDVEAFLEHIQPWRAWARARSGNPDTVTRTPQGTPRIQIESTPPSS